VYNCVYLSQPGYTSGCTTVYIPTTRVYHRVYNGVYLPTTRVYLRVYSGVFFSVCTSGCTAVYASLCVYLRVYNGGMSPYVYTSGCTTVVCLSGLFPFHCWSISLASSIPVSLLVDNLASLCTTAFCSGFPGFNLPFPRWVYSRFTVGLSSPPAIPVSLLAIPHVPAPWPVIMC